MKTLLLFALLTATLFSCDPNSDKKVGDADRFNSTNTSSGSGGGSAVGSGGTGNTGSSSSTTDAPLDGGLAFLLAAGAAYGVKRARSRRKTQEGEAK